MHEVKKRKTESSVFLSLNDYESQAEDDANEFAFDKNR